MGFIRQKVEHWNPLQHADGLNVTMVGNRVDANPDRLFSTLYVGQNATGDQRAALEKMLEYTNA